MFAQRRTIETFPKALENDYLTMQFAKTTGQVSNLREPAKKAHFLIDADAWS